MRPLRWIVTALAFAAFYLRDVVVSNLRIARDVLARRPGFAPAILSFPLGDLTDRQAFALATLLTMTPGSLSLEIDPERRLLHLHVLYEGDRPETLRARIDHEYARPVRILF